jgi:hypothetical protein
MRTKSIVNPLWEREHFLYVFWLDGDKGLGGGDTEAGRRRRLFRIETARKAGDLRFVNAIQNIQRHRKPTEDADRDNMETRKLILGSWLHLSLWAMDEASALAAACSLREGSNAGPTLPAWSRARERLKLVAWWQIGLKGPLFEFIDGRLKPVPGTKAGGLFLG